MTTTHGPGSAPIAPARRPIGPTIASVVALVVGAATTVGLLFLAVFLALCELGAGPEECTAEHDAAGLAVIAAGVVFLGVPAVVATVRRDARWLLVPVAEGAAVALAILAAARF